MAEALQPLLEQAVRESLRELARCAAEPETCIGGSQSIESIVRTVASKVLDEAGDKLSVLGAGAEEKAKREQEKRQAKKPPPEPLLQDIRATPWVVWREGSPSRAPQGRGRVQSEDLDLRDDHSEPTPQTMELRVEDVAPEESAPWARQASETEMSEVCDLDPHRFGAAYLEDEADAVPLPATRMARSMSASCAWEEDAGLFQHSSRRSVALPSGVASMVSPAHNARSMTLSPGTTSIGERPLIVKEGLTIPSNIAQHTMMQWKGRPRAVLLVAKPGDRFVLATVHDMAAWLASQGMVVVLEPQLLADQPSLRSALKTVRTFTKGDKLERSVDLVITVGGDGTLTWAVSLFGAAMPPVLSFAAGSLGFLTPFPLDGWVRTLTRLLDLHRPRRPLPLVCRMRLRVVVHRRKGSVEEVDGSDGAGVEVQCLNEVLVHRGQSGALAKLDVGVDGERVTLVQGDGLILATPTGSTAYSLAAGGSMAHPSVPAILLTPVSPHSLSFRPALLPDSAVITVAVPLTARYGAALSVDGKDVCALHLGDSVEVAMSPHPVPTICCTSETGDWFGSVHEALQWNGRLEQK